MAARTTPIAQAYPNWPLVNAVVNSCWDITSVEFSGPPPGSSAAM